MRLLGIARSPPMMLQVGLIGWSKKPSMTWTPAAAPIDEASSKPAFLASLMGLQLLLQDPRHPSLHFKRIGRLWSVRVGLHHRALAVERGGELVWIWICSHAEYDLLLRRKG